MMMGVKVVANSYDYVHDDEYNGCDDDCDVNSNNEHVVVVVMVIMIVRMLMMIWL